MLNRCCRCCHKGSRPRSHLKGCPMVGVFFHSAPAGFSTDFSQLSMISHYYRLLVAHPQLLFRSQRWSNSTPPGDSTQKKRLNLDFCVEAMGEEAAQLIINAFVAPGQKLCLSRVSYRARGMDQKLSKAMIPYNLRDEHPWTYILIYQLDSLTYVDVAGIAWLFTCFHP